MPNFISDRVLASSSHSTLFLIEYPFAEKLAIKEELNFCETLFFERHEALTGKLREPIYNKSGFKN